MVIESIKKFAELTPNRIALTDGHAAFSYAYLAFALKKLQQIFSLSRPKVLGIAMDNSPAWAMLDLAALSIQLPTVPLPLFFSPEQMAHTLRDARVDLLICDNPEQIKTLLKRQDIDIYAENYYLVGHKTLTALRLKINADNTDGLPDDTTKITYTSGTTGAPKGVCLSVNTLQKVAQSLCQMTEAQASDRHLSILPLSTLLENIAGLYVPLLAGATTVILPLKEVGLTGSSGFDVEKFMHAMSAQQATSLILTPELLLALVSAIEAGWPTPTQLRFIAVGGASVSPRLLERADAIGLPVFEGYGLSECASVVSLNTPQAKKIGSVGKPLPHVNLKFSDAGELLVNGANLLGLLGAHHVSPDEYINTGDIAHLDEKGFLYITGRKKNIFITSFGRNVAPEWVERELCLSPLIQQAALFGEAMPCNTAVIVSRPETSTEAIQNAIAQVNQTLPDYARVTHWLHASAPFSLKNGQLTANGRLRRADIWQMYQHNIQSLYKEHSHAVL